MQAQTIFKTPSVAIGQPGHLPQGLASVAWPAARLALWLAVGAAIGAAAFGLAQAGAADDALAQQLTAFQQRVSPEARTAAQAAPAAALAQRYLQQLPPQTRQRITDDVRAEQRAGTTAAGNEAFVMRRLELYEAALQQTMAVAAARAR